MGLCWGVSSCDAALGVADLKDPDETSFGDSGWWCGLNRLVCAGVYSCVMLQLDCRHWLYQRGQIVLHGHLHVAHMLTKQQTVLCAS